jgi:uncharacterized protein (UPF0303 family)
MNEKNPMNLDNDISRIAEQERRLRCTHFDLDRAWQRGARRRARAPARGLAVAIEIRLAGQTVFYAAMTDTTPANADWARRKRNTVELLHRSSYGVGRSLEREGHTLEQTMGLPARDYASHGGSFPLLVEGVGFVGVVTVSGAPQREDHELVVMALAELYGVALPGIALD